MGSVLVLPCHRMCSACSDTYKRILGWREGKRLSQARLPRGKRGTCQWEFLCTPALRCSLPKRAQVKGEEQEMKKQMRGLKELGCSLSRAARLANTRSTRQESYCGTSSGAGQSAALLPHGKSDRKAVNRLQQGTPPTPQLTEVLQG